MAETSEDSWEEHGAMNAMGSQQFWTCKGYGHVSRDCPSGKGKGKSKDNLARASPHTNGARATTTGTRPAIAGCTREVERRTVRPLVVSSSGTRRVTASLEGKDLVVASATKR